VSTYSAFPSLASRVPWSGNFTSSRSRVPSGGFGSGGYACAFSSFSYVEKRDLERTSATCCAVIGPAELPKLLRTYVSTSAIFASSSNTGGITPS
jgi:hypothetical protein